MIFNCSVCKVKLAEYKIDKEGKMILSNVVDGRVFSNGVVVALICPSCKAEVGLPGQGIVEEKRK